jgi:hypothetical protein
MTKGFCAVSRRESIARRPATPRPVCVREPRVAQPRSPSSLAIGGIDSHVRNVLVEFDPGAVEPRPAHVGRSDGRYSAVPRATALTSASDRTAGRPALADQSDADSDKRHDHENKGRGRVRRSSDACAMPETRRRRSGQPSLVLPQVELPQRAIAVIGAADSREGPATSRMRHCHAARGPRVEAEEGANSVLEQQQSSL